MNKPHLSIIIPMYNRERLIARAINSCLQQNFDDYEIIVVDDASTDKSVDVVKAFNDSRIRLLCHGVNRSQGPARNTGVDAASGEWVVFFDSDDEMLPGALSIIHERSLEVPVSISRMQFMGRIDTGRVTPDPPLKNEAWNYASYIKWIESTYGRLQDTMPVIRRKTFEQLRFYEDRTPPGMYHLDFMKRFHAWTFPDVVANFHQDADNQMTKPDMKRTLDDAKDNALIHELMLKIHGEALKKYAPRVYKNRLSGLSTLCFLSNNRRKGARYALSSLANDTFSSRNWVILLCGLLGPKPLAWLQTIRSILKKKYGRTSVVKYSAELRRP